MMLTDILTPPSRSYQSFGKDFPPKCPGPGSHQIYPFLKGKHPVPLFKLNSSSKTDFCKGCLTLHTFSSQLFDIPTSNCLYICQNNQLDVLWNPKQGTLFFRSFLSSNYSHPLLSSSPAANLAAQGSIIKGEAYQPS